MASVSVLVQLATERTGLHPVSREVFRPRPNVESALVAFRRTAPGAPRRASSGSSRRRSATVARRSRTRSRSPASPRASGRSRRSRRSAASANVRAEELEPRRVRRARGSARVIGAAPAKINLALVVGPRPRRRQARARDGLPARRPRRPDRRRARGRDDRRGLPRRHDRARARSTRSRRAVTAGGCGSTSAIPVAAGLGGGSSDAATALRLANAQLDAAAAADRAARARCAASAPTSRSSSRTGPQLGTRRRHDARAARAAAGLRRAPAPAGGRAQALDRRRLRGVRRARRARPASRSVLRSCWTRSRPSRGRATSPRSRRTTSRARRSPTSCARSERSAPTSPAPVRPSTGSSTDRATRRLRSGRLRRRGRTLDHGSSVVRLIARCTARTRSSTARRAAGRWLRERRLRITLWIAAFEGAALPLPRPPLVGRRRAGAIAVGSLVVRRARATARTPCARRAGSSRRRSCSSSASRSRSRS